MHDVENDVARAQQPPTAAAMAPSGVPLPETLTLTEARQTVAALEAALAATPTGQTLQIDCSGLRVLDSAALSVLLQAQRVAHTHGRHLRLHEPPAKLQALAGLYGVQDLLGLGLPPTRKA
ncbi:MAG: anti-sigma-factor antagonist [Pseudomonadota bacterium]|jgi:phospholipid transport system transporter-binding protein